MTPFLMLAAAAVAADPAGGWQFHDKAARDGRPAVAYKTLALEAKPSAVLHAEDVPPVDAKFGAVSLGVTGRLRVGVVWHAATARLWCDADGDGRYAAGERHALGDEPLEIAIDLPTREGTTAPRTLLIRRRGDGVAAAVRGYTLGTVAVAGKPVAAVLTDGNGNGVYGEAGADRVWLDFDGDGAFDALTEQFTAGDPVAAGGTALLVAARPDGLGATARVRPAATGTLRVSIDPRPGCEVVELRANYLSEFGELVTVLETDRLVELAAGNYRIDSLTIKLLDADGKLWRYRFWCPKDHFPVAVTAKRGTAHAPLDGLTLSANLGAVKAGPSGRRVEVSPVISNVSLTLSQCDAGPRHTDYAPGVPAELQLSAPGSVRLDGCRSQFMCGGLCPQTLGSPREVPADGLEVRATYPTGPLAGELTVTTPLPPGK